MVVRNIGILTVIAASLAASVAAMAQAPAPVGPPPVWAGNIGGGLALTNGNTSTRNFNLTGAFARDPKTRNVIKGTGSYFRGTQSEILNVDRTAINVRDEYAISQRAFSFGQLD